MQSLTYYVRLSCGETTLVKNKSYKSCNSCNSHSTKCNLQHTWYFFVESAFGHISKIVVIREQRWRYRMIHCLLACLDVTKFDPTNDLPDRCNVCEREKEREVFVCV